MREKLIEIVINQNKDQTTKGDSIITYKETSPFYKDISISLIDDAGDFKISQIHENDNQQIDSVSGNRWHCCRWEE